MALLHAGSIQSYSGKTTYEYKVFGDGKTSVIWLFHEPIKNLETSVTNCIEILFGTCMPALQTQFKEGFLTLGQVECESRLAQIATNALSSSTRGMQELAIFGLARELYSLLSALQDVFKDYKTMMQALASGQVFQHIPAAADYALEKQHDVVQEFSIQSYQFGGYQSVPTWLTKFAQFGATV